MSWSLRPCACKCERKAWGGANQRSSHTRSHLLRGHGPGVPLALEPRLPQVGGGIVIIESKAKGALLPLILFFDEKGDMDMIFGGRGNDVVLGAF